MLSQSARDEAEAHVELGLAIHLAVYLVVGTTLLLLNHSRNPESSWSYWAVGGWGIGALVHGLSAFAIPRARERMIARTAERLQHRESHWSGPPSGIG